MTEVMIQIDLHLQREKVPYLQEYNLAQASLVQVSSQRVMMT
jgi:hypothetical protein